MTAQTATYGMDYLNHAQPKDVLRCMWNNSTPFMSLGRMIVDIKHDVGLTIPCHQFAASVIGRLADCILFGNERSEWESFEFVQDVWCFYSANSGDIVTNLPINPFHGMTMPDGSPRTSCTREEFDEWKKDLE